MSIEIVKTYDSAVAQLQEKHRNVDPFLLLKSSMLARKYPSEKKQKFWLDVQLRHGADEEAFSRKTQHMVGLVPASHGHGNYHLTLQVSLDTVLAIADVPDLEWVGGEVYPNT